jgi:ABC-type maltose transport system permease subunit
VILPLALPGLAITALFGFMAGWTEFAMAWLMLEKPDTFTLAMVLRQMTSGGATRSVPWSEVFAFSTLLALPVTIFFLLLQRYIVGGLTAGAVKG